MKHIKIMKIFTFVLLIATIAIAITTLNTQGQKQQPTQDKSKENNQNDDLSQFPIAEYDAPEPENIAEREKRKAKSKRYDKNELVSKNPLPHYSGGTLFDESTPPPAIPTAESELVIVGEVVKAEAHLTTAKRNVYSEFTVRIEEVIKGNKTAKAVQESLIIADRPGGYVKYPNGQKLLYRIATKELPRIGRRYVLFLANPNQSPNYEILTGYELRENKVYPLDINRRFENFTGTGETEFIKAIRETAVQPSQQVNNQ